MSVAEFAKLIVKVFLTEKVNRLQFIFESKL